MISNGKIVLAFIFFTIFEMFLYGNYVGKVALANNKGENVMERVTEKEWEKTVGVLKDGMNAERDRRDLPYELIQEISKKEWSNLVESATKPGMSNQETNVSMWRKLYKLNYWLYINLGDGMKPYAGVVDNKPSLMLFTSPEIANEFIKTNKLEDRKEEVSLVGFIMPGTLQTIQDYQHQGIEWINFNAGTETPFGGPISLLQMGYRWHMENDVHFRDKR